MLGTTKKVAHSKSKAESWTDSWTVPDSINRVRSQKTPAPPSQKNRNSWGQKICISWTGVRLRAMAQKPTCLSSVFIMSLRWWIPKQINGVALCLVDMQVEDHSHIRDHFPQIPKFPFMSLFSFFYSHY